MDGGPAQTLCAPPRRQPFDWTEGLWSQPERASAAALVLSADWAPIRAFREPLAACPEEVYGDLLEVLRSADLRIVNLECVLSDRGAPVSKSGSVFKGQRRHIKGLLEIPFDAVTLANNHQFDYGLEAFSDSLGVLDQAGIRRTGAGLDAEEARTPLLLKTGSLTVAIVNFCEGEDLTAAVHGPGVFGWEPEQAALTVEACRRRADLVVAIVHGGLEYIPFPPPYFAQACRGLVRAGAHLVVGHHPHVPQGIEWYEGVPICYSLGNFVFYQPTPLRYRRIGYLVRAGMDREGLTDLGIIPYGINQEGLALLRGPQRKWFFDRLQAVSEPLALPHGIRDGWHGFLGHYGLGGFREELRMLTEHLERDAGRGAAMFRNRLTTMQHYHHWRDLMTHIMDDTLEQAPEWTRKLAREWLTEPL